MLLFLALDLEELLSNGQYHEAVLPLPTCLSNTGCRAVVKHARDGSTNFNLPELFHISTKVASCSYSCRYICGLFPWILESLSQSCLVGKCCGHPSK
jgi:hypothetical protein